ncbi:MAG: Regulatory protein BlaR1, partial [Verrucomicrobiales bacterium]|nr:Regulatory protein BlaR1 [Verrucomicrobiales bacterium]
MTTVLNELIEHINFTGVVLDTALKSFVVLALAGGVCLCLRRLPAAGRHLIWFMAVASLPCLPFVTVMTPTWHRPLWSISSGPNAGNELSLTLELNPRANSVSSLEQSALANKDLRLRSSPIPSHNRRLATHVNFTLLGAAVVIWIIGVLAVLYSFFRARHQLRILELTSIPLEEETVANLLTDVCRTFGLRRSITLLLSTQQLMPVTWGSRKHFILLPAQSESWSLERLRIVLLHEGAHVKRLDCLTQTITSLVCALYWFNPLVWLAARSMRVERERACDDLVLNGGCKASEYASQLLEIARTFHSIRGTAGIAVARSSKLEQRITAIVDDSRARRAPNVVLVALGCTLALGLVAGIAAQDTVEMEALRKQQIKQLQRFSAAKQDQAFKFATAANEKILPEFQTFFNAAIKGDVQTVTNLYADFKRRHAQYSSQNPDPSLSTSSWQPVLEISLAYFDVAAGEPNYTRMAVSNIIGSIPAGSIYFGGTDPGRGLITAFSKSQIAGDPFFTLTQNALADTTYLEYLRWTYGAKLKLPSEEDSKKC